VDRALYFPKDWTSNLERLKQAHVPDGVVFATKPTLASMMIERSIEAGVPFHWLAPDSAYGVGDVERTLCRAGIGYVLGVKGNHWFGSRATERLIAGEAKDIAAELSEGVASSVWGNGTKGERLYDWAYLPFADLDAEEFDCSSPEL